MMTALLDNHSGASAPLRRIWRLCISLWERVAIYMPLLMMAALALSTYWLVRNTPVVTVPETPKESRHEVDYFMRKFTLKTFDDNGKLKSEIDGLEARHFSDTDISEIDQARIRSVGAQGVMTTATANRAYINSDGSEVQLTGNALVVRQASRHATNGDAMPRLEFRGEFLHAFLNEERLKSHKPVVLIRGADRFTGDTFSYENLDGVVELKGRVHGVLVPKSGGPSSGAKQHR